MSDPNQEPPFFIGWEETPAASISRFLKTTTTKLILLSLVVAGLAAGLQKTITNAWFDFGNVEEFSGLFLAEPTPMLVADEPIDGEKILYLVAPLKYGLSPEIAEAFHLKQVTFSGTFLADDLEAMIEVLPESLTIQNELQGSELSQTTLGKATLSGEIVDSKCHLGLMNPGRFKAHRACAIQCLSGGIPPILVAQDTEGVFAYYLLVGTEGQAIHNDVLDFVAEPVELTGLLKKVGDRNVVYLNPANIRRL